LLMKRNFARDMRKSQKFSHQLLPGVAMRNEIGTNRSTGP
jgi:hypothetical protein